MPTHGLAPADECVGDVVTDEAGHAGDQHGHSFAFPSAVRAPREIVPVPATSEALPA